jgi:hypothetical protein
MSLFAVVKSSNFSLAVLFLKFSNSANNLKFFSFSLANKSSLDSSFPSLEVVFSSIFESIFSSIFCS